MVKPDINLPAGSKQGQQAKLLLLSLSVCFELPNILLASNRMWMCYLLFCPKRGRQTHGFCHLRRDSIELLWLFFLLLLLCFLLLSFWLSLFLSLFLFLFTQLLHTTIKIYESTQPSVSLVASSHKQILWCYEPYTSRVRFFVNTRRTSSFVACFRTRGAPVFWRSGHDQINQ